MQIKLLGHSSFSICLNNGKKIITDPYEHLAYAGSIKYFPILPQADVVTVSHHHSDHDFVEDFTNSKVIDYPGKEEFDGFVIEGISSFHDKVQGEQRGENIIFLIKAEELTVAHCGDLGTVDLDYKKFSPIDILMVPIGGLNLTLNAKEALFVAEKLKAKIVIPMHYKTEKIDLELDGLKEFCSQSVFVEKKDLLDISKKDLPQIQKSIVLNYQM